MVALYCSQIRSVEFVCSMIANCTRAQEKIRVSNGAGCHVIDEARVPFFSMKLHGDGVNAPRSQSFSANLVRAHHNSRLLQCQSLIRAVVHLVEEVLNSVLGRGAFFIILFERNPVCFLIEGS